MATIRRELTAKKDGDGKAEFLLRFTIRRGLQWRLHTSLRILPELWDDEDKRIRFPRLDRSMINELRQLDETLKDIESLLYKVCETDDVSILTREKLEAKIADFLRPQIIEEEEKAQEKASKHSCEMNMKSMRLRSTRLFIKRIRPIHVLFHGRRCRPTRLHSCLRSFFKGLVANGVITSSPFQKYHGIVSENYGTPYYITLDERNIIADHDFSKSPSDALQRDIFIFQTLIGCRVSDLYRMTPKNIINGALSGHKYGSRAFARYREIDDDLKKEMIGYLD